MDTNVLLYASDRSAGPKGFAANDLLRRLVARNAGAVSTQVVVEFFDAATRARGALPARQTRADADAAIQYFLRAFACLAITEPIVREAIRISRVHQMRIFDAQLVATARAAGVTAILTEDLQSARSIEGVRYVDPFARSFRPAAIGL